MTNEQLNKGTIAILKTAQSLYINDELNSNHPVVQLHNKYVDNGKDLHGLFALDLAQLKPGLKPKDYPLTNKNERNVMKQVLKQISTSPELKKYYNI